MTTAGKAIAYGIVPLVVAFAAVGVYFSLYNVTSSSSTSSYSSDKCSKLPTPHDTPSSLNSTVELVRHFWTQVTPDGTLNFSNATIVVGSTRIAYLNNNSYFDEYVNSTGTTNFIGRVPNASIELLLVPLSPFTNGSEKAVLVTIRPQLNLTFTGGVVPVKGERFFALKVHAFSSSFISQ